MKNFILLALTALMLSTGLVGCGTERIDAGHVGIKVNLYGSDKGVDDITAVTGRVWYNPMSTEIHEVPTFMQNAVYTKSTREGENYDESITFQTSEGMEIGADIAMNYRLDATMVPEIFRKFRKDPLTLQGTYLRTQVRDLFVNAASGYSVENFIAKKKEFLAEVMLAAKTKLEPEGFLIDTLTFVGSPRYPAPIVRAIQAKINATQVASQKERELEQTKADAKKAVAQARGAADSAIQTARGKTEAQKLVADVEAYQILTQAHAKAKAIREVNNALSDRFIAYTKVTTWDGVQPKVVSGGDSGLLIDLRK